VRRGRELVDRFLVLIRGGYRDFLRRISLILIFDSYAWIEFSSGQASERVKICGRRAWGSCS